MDEQTAKAKSMTSDKKRTIAGSAAGSLTIFEANSSARTRPTANANMLHTTPHHTTHNRTIELKSYKVASTFC